MKLPIFHLVFPTNHLMASSLLRFQEHSESPKYRGKFFTHEEFMDWYAKENGSFSYFEDWIGFNFRDDVVYSLDGLNDLTAKEMLVRRVVDQHAERVSCSRFYVIATAGGENVVDHEIVHALFHLNPRYAKKVRALCRILAPELAPFVEWLRLHYHRAVWKDECNAYMTTGLSSDCALNPDDVLMEQFQNLFHETFDFRLQDLSDPSWLKKNIYTIDMKSKLSRIKYL